MYNFNEMEQNTLLCLLIRTDFPPSSKVWFLASSANLTAMNKGTMFPIFVQEATGSGEIGYEEFNRFFSIFSLFQVLGAQTRYMSIWNLSER